MSVKKSPVYEYLRPTDELIDLILNDVADVISGEYMSWPTGYDELVRVLLTHGRDALAEVSVEQALTHMRDDIVKHVDRIYLQVLPADPAEHREYPKLDIFAVINNDIAQSEGSPLPDDEGVLPAEVLAKVKPAGTYFRIFPELIPPPVTKVCDYCQGHGNIELGEPEFEPLEDFPAEFVQTDKEPL